MAKIIIPDTIFGDPVDGAIDRVLAGAQQNKPIIKPIINPNVQPLNGFIYVPSINLYVAKEKTLHGKDWDQAQEELKNQNQMMLPPYQFREFLKFLRDSQNPEHIKIFKDITEVKSPWRAEWINARFEKTGNKINMISENVLNNGKYITPNIKLDTYLINDRTPGISLDEWLDSNAKHGLPKSGINQGELSYWAPVDGRVSWFGAGSDRTCLICHWDRSFTHSVLGVRACREATAGKI
jgi:hypothetical protein